MSLLDSLIMLIYFAVMIGASYWGLTMARSVEDYLVAGWRLGPFMYIGCPERGGARRGLDHRRCGPRLRERHARPDGACFVTEVLS